LVKKSTDDIPERFHQSCEENPPGGGRLNLEKFGILVQGTGPSGMSRFSLEPSCSPVRGFTGSGLRDLLWTEEGGAADALLL